MKNTFAAISTGLTNSGISIVRMCGSNAVEIIDRVFKAKSGKKISEAKSHTIHYGHIYNNDEIIDEVLVMYMKGPNSYTGEDTIEVNCHGGVLVTRKILETLISAGARAAEPGEFTKTAFLNGKMDLSRAEAVMDVINAKNDFALSSSVKQLSGRVCEKIKAIREKIIFEIAFIESALDDPEHYNSDGYGEKLKPVINEQINSINDLFKTVNNGKILKEGINTVIVGKPNAGKSSLLNLLVGEEKAIVTEIEGTTRDVLEENIIINGIQLNIIDTAGIRNTDEVVEKIGVERAIKYAKDADLILYVVDSSKKLDESDEKIIDLLKDKQVIVLLNKTDLNMETDEQIIKKSINKKVIPISAKENKGIEALENEIRDMFLDGQLEFNDEIYITNARHVSELQSAKESFLMVIKSINDDMPEDFYSIDMMNAYEHLGNIIGESVEEDLVNEIFEKFCMGK